MERYLTHIGKYLVALGGESSSSSRELRRDSCVQLYQWTHCIRTRNKFSIPKIMRFLGLKYMKRVKVL
jgi:hypothetical protein